MATELQIAQGFQTLLLAMDEFAPGDVVLNDDSIYDAQGATYKRMVIIWTVEEFDLSPASSRNISRLTVPVVLIEPFTNREETYNNLRATRQAILDEVFTGAGMSANGLEGTMVTRIRNDSEIVEWSYLPDDGDPFPVFVQQAIGVEVELF